MPGQSIDGPPGPGVTFGLKPKGGPRPTFVIGAFEEPCRHADVCRMPLATMRRRHTLIPLADGTTIRVDVEMTGALAPFRGRIVGRRQAAGLPAHNARFIDGARARSAQGRRVGRPSGMPPVRNDRLS